MDTNGLNINQPLLSVRRFSSIASSSSSSQKNENRKNERHVPTKPCKTESTSVSMMKSGSVPFVWEQSPGRPKNERNKQIQITENIPSLPKLPPGRFFRPRKIIKSPKSTKKQSCNPQKHDQAYMDALDTPSRGETSLNNCSASGSDVKPSAFLRADPKTTHFLGRFLPAAREMASDVSQHTSKKAPIKEKPQEVKKPVNLTINSDKVQLYGPPNILQEVAHDKEKQEDEKADDYDSDHEQYETGKKSSKFCGLIPRFRSVNPVYRMCPANRIQASSSSSGSFKETASEPARSAVYKHRSINTLSIEPSNLEGSKLYNRLQGPAISVDHSGSFQSNVSEQSDSSSKKKGMSFWDLLTDTNTNEITEKNSQDSIIEKTLYVDTVRVIESPKENSFPACVKPQSTFKFNEALESDDDLKAKGFKDTIEFELFGGGGGDAKGKQKLKASETWVFQHLPLPKSPSDSWLCRTLPSVSSKRAAAPTLWIPKYSSSSNMVVHDTEAVHLHSPQEEMNAVPES